MTDRNEVERLAMDDDEMQDALDGMFHALGGTFHAQQDAFELLEKTLSARLTEAEARAADAYDEAAGVGDYFAEMDYAAMHYPEEGAIAASGTAHEIRQQIRALATPAERDALARIREEAFRQGFNAGVTAGRNLREIKDEPTTAIRGDDT